MRQFLLLFALIFINLNADQYAEEYELVRVEAPIFVPLGSDCLIPLRLRANHLRKAAFPFDWSFTIVQSGLIQLLDDDFKYFLSRDHLILIGGEVRNSYYKIEFKHDGSFFDPERLTPLFMETCDKYQRRIDRFRELNNYPGRVVFIRSAIDCVRWPISYYDPKVGKIDQSETEALKEALHRFFPNQDFVLVIINYDTPDLPPIVGLENVIEYKISHYHKWASYQQIISDLVKRFS